ncbi:MAG TPA: hypothetical protein VGG10_13520 [Rhizomicrobium sp.]
MTRARDAIVRYQKLSDDYQTCLVTAASNHRKSPPFFSRFYDDGFEAAAEDLKHQNQVDKETAVGEFNAAVRIYNTMHP